jgi:hypothetical protein
LDTRAILLAFFSTAVMLASMRSRIACARRRKA